MSGRGRGINNAPAWMAQQQPPPYPDGSPQGVAAAPPPQQRPPDYYDDRDMPSQHRRQPQPPGGGGGDGFYNNDRRGPPPPQGRYGGDRRFPPDHHHRRGSGDFRPRGGPPPGPPTHHRGGGGPRGGGGGGRPPHRRGGGGGGGGPPGLITFRSYEEERAFVEDRRDKRLKRTTKFDLQPTPAQIQAAAATGLDAAAAAAASIAASVAAAAAGGALGGGPQQTRHARRLYVGNLPLYVTEDQLHHEFQRAIALAWAGPEPLTEDPVLSVYINHERRFCFVEFKTVEMTTACMALDGLVLQGLAVKVKRPNDYNEIMAPKVSPADLPQLDVSRLGIVGGTVQDGPNKIFIGGLHYHLTQAQVLELLQAFGKVKAFHLVKGDGDNSLSKGYCFAEYSDPNVTAVAIHGLNGMDIGGGKSLTARLAGERAQGMMAGTNVDMGATMLPAVAAPVATMSSGALAAGAPPPDRNIVAGYDIEALVDAACGLVPMPAEPVYKDAMGMPLTRIVHMPSVVPLLGGTSGVPPAVVAPPPVVKMEQPSPHDYYSPPPPQMHGNPGNGHNNNNSTNGNGNAPTRVLALLHMVQAQDLATDEDHRALTDEVREECAKFGHLLDIQIPRQASHVVKPTAVGKIFLRYATIPDAQRAGSELAGRQFGDSVVELQYYAEEEFEAGRLA